MDVAAGVALQEAFLSGKRRVVLLDHAATEHSSESELTTRIG